MIFIFQKSEKSEHPIFGTSINFILIYIVWNDCFIFDT